MIAHFRLQKFTSRGGVSPHAMKRRWNSTSPKDRKWWFKVMWRGISRFWGSIHLIYGLQEQAGSLPTTWSAQGSRRAPLIAWPALQAFLNTQGVKDVLNKTSSPLAAITVLKKVCVHPNLLSERAADAVAKGGRLLA